MQNVKKDSIVDTESIAEESQDIAMYVAIDRLKLKR